MIARLSTRRSSSVPARLPAASPRLQRKCACGRSSAFTECEECAKKKLRRKTRETAEGCGFATSPPIVHDVLSSPGQPLDGGTRSFFEARFGHDFSKVRVHADERAARSAHAVNAMAYTVGHNVVFGSGQYKPRTFSGQSLLAHELTHVVQQHGQTSGFPLSISNASDPSEHQAENVARHLANGSHRFHAPPKAAPQLMRKLSVLDPAELIPNPDGKGLKQTNAETIEGYLKTMAEGSGVTVNRTSGDVSVSTAYCPGFAGGFLAGAKKGFGIFKNIPVLNVLLGGPAALIGGLIGGIGGLFGGQSSAAASSKTPTGSTCLCDMIGSSTLWKIALNDTGKPFTGSKSVSAPSPNSRKIWGSAAMSGRLTDNEPWLILAHELCGHAWLEEKGQDENRRIPPSGIHDMNTGKPFVASNDPLNAGMPFRHERTVERENLIRKEHGIEARGYRLGDPYCGESFWRERGIPNPPEHFQEGLKGSGWATYLEECEFLRSQLPENKDGHYRIDEKIPMKEQ